MRFLLLALLISVPAYAADLQVHEWGTFTSFQDEKGQALDAINTDDEPVPSFVHELARNYSGILSPTDPPVQKGAPYAFTGVTTRLETPVIYFHLPKNSPPVALDISVRFNGGWLTQFYPAASALADNAPVDIRKFPQLTGNSVGSLDWKHVSIGQSGHMPETSDVVWTTPRKVEASDLTINNESERFLFYRGVGHIDSPLQVRRDNHSLHIKNPSNLKIPAIWLLEVRTDHSAAFRTLDPNQLSTADDFDNRQFSASNIEQLKSEMHRALLAEGLNSDEATALLNTWQVSYFQSPGQRIFYIVPQSWTDSVLPLTISQPAGIKRAMVGRIELVTPHQRELLNQLAAMPLPNLKEVVKAVNALRESDKQKYNALASGYGNLADLNVPAPEAYRIYLELGRFRVALLLNSEKSLPGLQDFYWELTAPGTGISQRIREQRLQKSATSAAN